MKAAMRIYYRDGQWEVHNGETVVVRFDSSSMAYEYKAAYENRKRKMWRRKKVA